MNDIDIYGGIPRIDDEFLGLNHLIEINQSIIEETGGLYGIRDKNSLDSSIGSPINIYLYETDDIIEIASIYAYSITRNHPFIDGNKRTGFIAMDMFLRINNIVIDFPEDETIDISEKLADKKISLDNFRLWLK